MPVTRSSSNQPQLRRGRQVARMTVYPSTGVPPSSDHDSMPTDNKAPRRNNKKDNDVRSRPLPPLRIESEIIEISSDDDDSDSILASKSIPPVAHATLPSIHSSSLEPSAIADLRRQISKYRQEAAKSKKDLEKVSKEATALRLENQELQKLRNSGSGKVTLDTNDLSEHMECEICTSRMWTPNVLPDCGHTFCQSCLQDWFGATQAQFMATHPTYDPNQLISNPNFVGLYNIVQNVIHHPHTANSPQVTALVAQILPPHPQYTCPTCRGPVTSRPIEVFALKALYRTVTSAMGEDSPKRPKTIQNGPVANPWEGFFPSRKA